MLTTMLRVADSYASSLMVSEAETVYDFCWYPYMYASGEDSSAVASSLKKSTAGTENSILVISI